ncbi:hypothetical protein HBB16_14610 [Pseudonocardia sp. MCCB 268]|nr:hypothetical protein [Pseudonocardia cytotoxica]
MVPDRRRAALAELTASAGRTAAQPGSLEPKALPRWENGTATPAPEHQALLRVEAVRRHPTLTRSRTGGPGDRPWRPTTGSGRTRPNRCARRRRPGAARRPAPRRGGAGPCTSSARRPRGTLTGQVEQLRELLALRRSSTAERLAELLAGAALLAGDQERDRGAPDLAWHAYVLAGEVAGYARSDLAALAHVPRAAPARLDLPANRPCRPAAQPDRDDAHPWCHLGQAPGATTAASSIRTGRRPRCAGDQGAARAGRAEDAKGRRPVPGAARPALGSARTFPRCSGRRSDPPELPTHGAFGPWHGT